MSFQTRICVCLRVLLALSSCASIFLSRTQCSSFDFPWTRMLSILQNTASNPISTLRISRWNISGAEQIPTGNLLQTYHPNRVMKVVNSYKSGCKLNCQYTQVTSNLLNTLECPNLARASFSVGNGWCSLFTGLLRFVKSIHTPSLPFFLGTAMQRAHHFAGL